MMATLFCVVLWAQAPAGTTLFSENFGGYAANDVPSGSVSSLEGSRVIYGGGSVTYTSVDNGKNITKIYAEALASGTSPELLVGKSGGVFTVAGIPSGNAQEITVSFKQNAQKLTVSLVGTGYSTEYASPKPSAAGEVTFDVTVADGADATFSLIMTAGSSNVRVDDILVTVKTASESAGGETPQPTHTYTVAGDNATLFGTTWAPTNEDNDMTLVEGLYTWEKTNQTLPAGNVAFKVCEDHAWTNCWPAQNYQLAITEAGIYTITITYNPANNAVNAVASKTGAAVVIPTVAMHGNFTGNWVDTENFAVAEGNETASLTLNLAAGDYEFGMRIGGSGNWTANGAAFTRENNSAVIVAGQGNITLDADAAGEYTFTWTYETNTLTITYPEFVPPTYTYADGYYLIGLDMQDWTMEYMPTEGRLFAANPDNEGEYQLTITLAADQQFKVVSVQKDHIKAWYPDGVDNNFIVDAAHAGEKTVYFRPDGQGGEGWHYGCIYVAANEDQPEQPEEGSVIVKWDADAEQVIGQVIYHAAAATASTKIHNNEDDVTAINLSKSYKYADDQYVVIKPATGTFKAGDKVTFNTFINNATADGSKYGAVYFYAADGATVLFHGQNGINGRTSNDEPVVENFTLEADQDSIMFGRYGNTATYVSVLNVTRVGGDEPIETPKFYITGNAALVGQDKEWNPGAIPSMEDSKVLALEAGSYMMKITTNGAWEGENNVKGYDALTGEIPAGVTRGENENNDNICFTLAEAGDVTVTYTAESFTIAGNFYVAPKVAYYLIGDSAFVVDAGATADKAWTPDAIASLKDTTVLHLKAGVNYIMRLSLEGTWENHRDFRHLTDTAVGLIELPDEFGNHSIGFSLAEAGDVTIIYIPAANEQPEVFKLIGNFYVAPAPDPTVAVMGSMNNWAEEIPFVLSDDKTYASLTVENIGADNYEFKFVINGEWRSNGYTYHRGFPGAAGITENNDANMIFQADVDGEYTFYWYFANDSAAIVYPELPFTCDWENIAWLDGSNEQIKVCKESEAVSVINVQKPSWAAEKGIYMTFPSAAWGAISLEEGSYVTEGAGLLVYLSALTQEYNEISIVCQDVEYIINIYNAANAPKPVFYLVGNFNEWTAAEAYKFALNPNNDAEYVLTATLAEKDSLKVIRVMEGEETVWYPADAENYVVDAAHAGEKDIYFRPDYQGGEDWYAQCIYVAENAPQGCDWDHIDFIGSDVPELADQFKLCKEGQYPSVINIQNSFGTEAGIYVTFPSAAFGEISMTEGTYAIQGAGMLLYCSAFTDVETEVSIVCDGNPIIFTVYNAEGSAPVVDPTVSVKGSMNDWAEEIPFVLSDDKTYASLTVENISAGNYEFKFIINGEWRSNGYRYHRGFPGAAGITKNNEANMTFEADIDGEYTFYWYFANDSAAIVYPAKPEPVLANGYYLVGSMNEWTPAAENLFAVNPDNDAEYQLAINLDVNTEIKVVYVENDAIVTWYPAEGENYVIDDHHNGATTVYFRPDGQGGEDWYNGVIYVVPTSTVDITNIDANAPAVKILRDGQLLIIKGEKTFNAQGQLVK